MHAQCNLGVHDMNNTILMIWSEGLRMQFGNLIRRNVEEKSCELQIADTLAVYRLTKQTEVMNP